jgi:hypothetical protein
MLMMSDHSNLTYALQILSIFAQTLSTHVTDSKLILVDTTHFKSLMLIDVIVGHLSEAYLRCQRLRFDLKWRKICNEVSGGML